MNGIEEYLTGRLELVRRLVVAELTSKCVEYFKIDPRFQIAVGIGQ